MMWWIAGIIALLTILRNEADKNGASAAKPADDVAEAVRRAARNARVPEETLLAMAQVESSMRHLSPKPDPVDLAYYPLGMHLIAAQTVEPNRTKEELQQELRTLDGNLRLGAKYLKRGLTHYDKEDPLLRIWWVRPATSRAMKAGKTPPTWTRRSIDRYQQAREMWMDRA